MSGPSLKIRLLAIQAVAMLLALGLTGLGLLYLFDRHVERRIGSELDNHITRIAAGIGFAPSGLPKLNRPLSDPAFRRIFSGLYWQIRNEREGLTARSRSLWDRVLQLPADELPFNEIHIHNISGPGDAKLLVHERRLKFGREDSRRNVRIAVAIDRAELDRLSAAFAWDVAAALFILGIFLLVSGWVMVSLGLRPLAAIHSAINTIRTGRAARIEPGLPGEVEPLVGEINSLLETRDREIEAARNRANDLAHGFKTPLTALQADIGRLRSKGERGLADEINGVAMAMRRQIDRELASSRARFSRKPVPIRTHALVAGIADTLQRIPACEGKTIRVEIDARHQIRADRDDLAEILGNLMENAVKHGGDKIVVRARREDDTCRFEVEDNGKGISEELRRSVMRRGVRLDEGVPGTGLGLAIVKDILEAYQSEILLETPASGGLKASFHLPQDFR